MTEMNFNLKEYAHKYQKQIVFTRKMAFATAITFACLFGLFLVTALIFG